jgi:hypothetical protein
MNMDAAQVERDYRKDEFKANRKETCECFFCKKKGHIRKDCYQAIKADSKPYTPKEPYAKPAQNRMAEIVDD